MVNKRALTHEQRHDIINRLLKVWESAPELRLMQLMSNVFHGDNYYIEDFDLIETLENYYLSRRSESEGG